MSYNFQIITDGSCDLPVELVKEKNLTVVPFYVSFDGEHYKKEIEEVGVRDYYTQMVENPSVFPKTSMPSAQDYLKVFEPLAKEGIPAICICITTKFSGSMQSAVTARDMTAEKYPDSRITVIDAAVNTVLQGLLVLEAVKMQQAGWSCEETVRRIEAIKSTGRIFFTVGSIDYLKHGGRIGKLSGLAGSILGIKPLITLKEGEFFPSGITRIRMKSQEKVIGLLVDYLNELHADVSDYSLAVGFGYDRMEAESFRNMIVDTLSGRYPITQDKLPIFQIGATIGVHTGPYPIGLGIIERFDAAR